MCSYYWVGEELRKENLPKIGSWYMIGIIITTENRFDESFLWGQHIFFQ